MEYPFFRSIATHAASLPSEEVCGVVGYNNQGLLVALPITNAHEDRENFFKFDFTEYLEARKRIEVLACYHSHPKGIREFSAHDIAASEETELPYLLYADGDMVGYAPSAHRAKLTGRRYLPLINDCLSLCEDYVEKHWQSPVKRIPRTFSRSEDVHELLPAFFKENGLKTKTSAKIGDIAVMSLKGGKPDHVGVIWTEGLMIHQRRDSRSESVMYRGTWERLTTYVIYQP